MITSPHNRASATFLRVWPAVGLEVYPASQGEMDAFRFQQAPLAQLPIPPFAQAYLPLVVHDPLPGDTGARGERGHGIAHHPWARSPHEAGDATVGADATFRDLANRGVDAVIETG